MSWRQWTHDEIDKLHDLLTEYTNQDAVVLFLRWQDENPSRDGLQRTFSQVQKRASAIRQKCPLADRYAKREWARILKIPEHRALYALRHYRTKQRQGVPVRVVKKVARQHKSFLYEADRDAVAQYLGAEYVELCDKALPNACCVRVRSLDTGEVFPSVSAAARASYVDKSTMLEALDRRFRVNGRRFEKVS